MTDTPRPIPPERDKPLILETGFWRRVGDGEKIRQSDIHRVRDDLRKLHDVVEKVAGSAPEELVAELRKVQDQVEADFRTMTLAIQTLIEVMLEKEVMTEDEFADKMDEIDLRDGKLDGGIGPTKG